MKYFFLVMCVTTLCNKISAQDSTKVSPQQFSRGLANQFSQTRVLDIQYNMVGSRNIKSELLGTNLEETSIDATQDLDININIPLIKKQRWQLTYSAQYNYTSYNSNDFNQQSIQDDFHYFNSAISVTYFTRLLKRQLYTIRVSYLMQVMKFLEEQEA